MERDPILRERYFGILQIFKIFKHGSVNFRYSGDLIGFIITVRTGVGRPFGSRIVFILNFDFPAFGAGFFLAAFRAAPGAGFFLAAFRAALRAGVAFSAFGSLAVSALTFTALSLFGRSFTMS